jgi:glyoxylase-like metal-dependent hydrolase (beta-lactamase superfamily II)
VAKVTAVTQNVYMLAGIVARQYLVIGADGVVLIDTGLVGNEKNILKALAAIGQSAAALKMILITHADSDHYGATSALQSASGAKVYASALEAEAMHRGVSSRELRPVGWERFFYGVVSPLFRVGSTPVDDYLQAGASVGGLRVLASPGHTPGHVSLFLPEQRVLFAGDSIRIAGGQPRPSSGGNTWDLALARRSFESQMQLQPEYLCCGHGYLRLP